MADKMRNIGIPETMYEEMVKIQEKHKEEYNSNKAFYQIIEDWKKAAEKK